MTESTQHFWAEYALLGGKIYPNVAISTLNTIIIDFNPYSCYDSTFQFKIEGIVCAGLVNAHCHVELSHLRDGMNKGMGMVPFVQSVIHNRYLKDAETRMAEAEKTLLKLKNQGVVAIADTANESITASIKHKYADSVYTHTFLEVLGLKSELAKEILEKAQAQMVNYKGLAVSLTPHSLYAVSQPLMEALMNGFKASQSVFSIHLMESIDERNYFEGNESAFGDFFTSLNLPIRTAKFDWLQYIKQLFPKDSIWIAVHITEMTKVEYQVLSSFFPNLFICLCPVSNVFLHNRLPLLDNLDFYGGTICIGTDSPASNPEMDMMQELYTLQAALPTLPLECLLNTVTKNGAAFLGMKDQIGDIAINTAPGLVQISPVIKDSAGNLQLTQNTKSLSILPAQFSKQ